MKPTDRTPANSLDATRLWGRYPALRYLSPGPGDGRRHRASTRATGGRK